MSLATHLAPYVRAAFSGLYIETFEPEEALREIHALCVTEQWTVATWDIDRGLLVSGGSGAPAATDPLAALRSLPTITAQMSAVQATLDGLLVDRPRRSILRPKSAEAE